MKHQTILFIVLLLLNLCIVIGYLIWNYIRNKEKKISVWMKAAVMFLCPVIGPCFLCLAYLLYKFCMSRSMDLEDVIFSKERVETQVHPDEDTERNMVSLEEALAVTDKRNLRILMMNVIRGDYRNLLSSISMALNSEDSETSHYAASVLQDVLNDFRANVQKMYKSCCPDQEKMDQIKEDEKQKEEQVKNCIEAVEYMNPILVQGVFTEMEQTEMVDKMDEICEVAWQLNQEKISSSCYEKVSICLLEVSEYEKCRKWCQRAARQYPKVLASYTCRLKLYFSCGEKEKFFQLMDELKRSDIVIDNETLELIRTFM